MRAEKNHTLTNSKRHDDIDLMDVHGGSTNPVTFSIHKTNKYNNFKRFQFQLSLNTLLLSFYLPLAIALSLQIVILLLLLHFYKRKVMWKKRLWRRDVILVLRNEFDLGEYCSDKRGNFKREPHLSWKNRCMIDLNFLYFLKEI
jgi:hypothetical protein